jgi:hypothetical protein
MLIEVIKQHTSPNTDKGNLLEELAEEFLRTQGYEVSRQVRLAASELDLICKHKISGKSVYVECKAHRDALSGNILKNLLGTVEFHDYSEGWLVSTGPLGKDAKGFVEQWEKKTSDKRERLSIFTPARILQALLDAKIITNPPTEKAKGILCDLASSMGEWVLLITPWGMYWLCPVLRNGICKSAILFCAISAKTILDQDVFEKIKSSDFSFSGFEFLDLPTHEKSLTTPMPHKETAVVEVEFGERWFDYRPARPEHFVGRKSAQREILQFLTNVKSGRTDSRIFAIKGDSGIGKSSLVAKMRDVAKRSQKPNNLFLYAIDMRAANDSSYILSALVKALRLAASEGFGSRLPVELTNYVDPLQSESIITFLSECSKKHELIILVLDQFEELYSKPELFCVFEEAKRLMFSTISASSNLVLGFAWKTDCTVPQDHPAYHMWHQLSDHRFELTLRPFSHSDAENSLNIFEAELGEKIRSELRKYMLENSQGYPWLLKKLCIHFYEQFQNGTSQHQMANRCLDISSLFDQDLNNLSDNEMGCLKLVAKNAPMDWYEVLETSGHEVVQSLQNKRLIIRRGDKLNLYWDIFRDYVLSGTIPSIPFIYIPQSPSLDALLRVSLELDDIEGKSLQQLATQSKLQDTTVRNIVHDLEQFGLAIQDDGLITLDPHLITLDSKSVLHSLRSSFKRHALAELLRKYNAIKPATSEQIIEYLRTINATAQYQMRTWAAYATKMMNWLQVLGLVTRSNRGYTYSDSGDIADEQYKSHSTERKRIVFLGDASPGKAVEALEYIKIAPRSQTFMKVQGYRNACAVLYRFNLIEISPSGDYIVADNIVADSALAIWDEASKEESIKVVMAQILRRPSTTPEGVGEIVGGHFQREWTPATWKRVGNSLKQWSGWLLSSRRDDGTVPSPPGRTVGPDNNQPTLF